MARLLRSLLFVPGNNIRFLEKAKSLQADIVCFDLEDSVPLGEKKSARNLIKNALKNRSEYNSEIYVRTNSPVSGMIPDDLLEIIQKGVDGIVIPKVNTASEIKKIEKTMLGLEKKRKLKPIIEQQECRPVGGMIVLRMFQKFYLCTLESHRCGSHGIVMELLIKLCDQLGRSLVIKEPQ